jgi:hypothetical protein
VNKIKKICESICFHCGKLLLDEVREIFVCFDGDFF